MAAVKGWELVDVIEDAGASAKDTDRDGLRDVMARVKDVDAVIVAKLDRLTRSMKDLGALLESFGDCDAMLVSCAESLDTSTATGRMMVNMLGVIASWEREIIVERTRDALAIKFQRGERVGAPKFGWTVDGDGNLIENAAEQAAMMSMLELREEGKGWQAIANALNGAGFTTRRGGQFSRQGVQYIFKSVAVSD